MHETNKNFIIVKLFYVKVYIYVKVYLPQTRFYFNKSFPCVLSIFLRDQERNRYTVTYQGILFKYLYATLFINLFQSCSNCLVQFCRLFQKTLSKN